jgi:hypothetical protein
MATMSRETIMVLISLLPAAIALAVLLKAMWRRPPL